VGEDQPGVKETSWMKEGNCKGADPELFFPERLDHAGRRVAIAVCDGCPVTNLCLEYALKNRIETGIWGGMSTRDRRKLSRERQKER